MQSDKKKFYPFFKTGIGQDSHKFEKGIEKKCVLGGIEIDETPGLKADSDGDVILHALCNAVSSITHVPILGEIAIELCHKKDVKDSKVYFQKALESLKDDRIAHIAITIEGKRPRLQNKIMLIRQNIATLANLKFNQVGITVTSGDELTDFGKGLGIQCIAVITTISIKK